ncbi:MAG: hypothetical protein WAN79_07615 [Opitutaceae bacterium]
MLQPTLAAPDFHGDPLLESIGERRVVATPGAELLNPARATAVGRVDAGAVFHEQLGGERAAAK